MMRETKAQREWQTGQKKKSRSVFMMFASTVLTLEAFVVFFATLVIYGFHHNAVPWPVIFAGGIVMALILVFTCPFLGKKWGVLAGWIEQIVLILSGMIEPAMYVIGVLFALAWWYAVVTGKRLDRETKAREAAAAQLDQQQ